MKRRNEPPPSLRERMEREGEWHEREMKRRNEPPPSLRERMERERHKADDQDEEAQT